MIASKDWGPCACGCGKTIVKGDEFGILGGGMYLRGHEAKATKAIPVIKGDEEPARETKKKAARPKKK